MTSNDVLTASQKEVEARFSEIFTNLDNLSKLFVVDTVVSDGKLFSSLRSKLIEYSSKMADLTSKLKALETLVSIERAHIEQESSVSDVDYDYTHLIPYYGQPLQDLLALELSENIIQQIMAALNTLQPYATQINFPTAQELGALRKAIENCCSQGASNYQSNELRLLAAQALKIIDLAHRLGVAPLNFGYELR